LKTNLNNKKVSRPLMKDRMTKQQSKRQSDHYNPLVQVRWGYLKICHIIMIYCGCGKVICIFLWMYF